MNDWLAAGIAVVAGIVIGTIAARVVTNLLTKRLKSEALRSAAGPLGSLVFSAFLVAGLMTALGFVNREALDEIPNDLVNYIPRALSAAIVVILAKVLAELLAAMLERTTARMGDGARNIPTVARFTVLAFGAILAAAQLGINTTIINIAVAALLFSIGLGTALMIGLGSRRVSAEVAAGRALRRMVRPGDRVAVGDVSGEVVSVGSVAIELETADGTVLVPNSRLVENSVTVQRAARPDEP